MLICELCELLEQVLLAQVLLHLVCCAEGVELGSVFVGIGEGKLADEAGEDCFAVVGGDGRGIFGHEDVGRDASSAIDDASDACLVLLAFLPYAVLREELASFVACYEVVLVLFAVPFLVGFLYAPSAGSIVACNGEAHHASVAELHGLLHESFAKGASAYDGAAVVVLDGSCEYLACACAAFVHEDHDRQLLEGASSVADELFARAFASFGIDDELACGQELVDHLYGDVHVSAPVASEVHDESAHAFHVQVGKGDEHLCVGLFAEVLDVDVSCLAAFHHVVGIHADHGDVASHDGEVLQVLCSVAFDAQFDLRAFLSLEVLHDGIVVHADERYGVGRDDAVACQYADPFAGSAVDDGHDVDGVLFHCELHADAREGAFQVLACLLGILGAEVAAVRVEFAQYLRHGVLDEGVHIDGIDVVVVDELQQVAHFGGTCVDDVDASSREVAGVEGTDEDAHYGADGNEEGREAVFGVGGHRMRDFRDFKDFRVRWGCNLLRCRIGGGGQRRR